MNKTFKYEGHKCHLVAEINDNETDIIVYRWWRQHKQRWQYAIVEKWLYEATKKGWADL